MKNEVFGVGEVGEVREGGEVDEFGEDVGVLEEARDVGLCLDLVELGEGRTEGEECEALLLLGEGLCVCVQHWQWEPNHACICI